MTIWLAFFFAILGSIGAVSGAALILKLSPLTRKKILPLLVSFATGTLLGAAFLTMIPNALTQKPALSISSTLLTGILLFFVLERLLLWRHGHETGYLSNGSEKGSLILIGDAFHNFVDGVVIAAAFLVSIPLGISVSLAVIAHEIPQEIGDFAILLDAGYSPRRALVLNGLSASTALLGVMIGCVWLPLIETLIPYILTISAASFIYIAVADLIPTLHQRAGVRIEALQFLLIVLGIATIAILP